LARLQRSSTEENGVPPRGHQSGAVLVGESADHAQSEPDSEAFVVDRLERAVPSRGIHADGADLDAVLAGVPHDLRGRVEAHGLRVEQGGAEHVRMPAFHPGRRVS
jgi:hypothetical protein